MKTKEEIRKYKREYAAKWRKLHPGRSKEQARIWRKTKHADYTRAQYKYRAKQYGIPFEQFLELISKGCAACGGREKLCIDHDHRTGKVRAALCSACNLALGFLQESPERCRLLANYVERFCVSP